MALTCLFARVSDSSSRNLFIVGDNLRKGTALKGVPIAEALVSREFNSRSDSDVGKLARGSQPLLFSERGDLL
jgi:hypothetical protein